MSQRSKLSELVAELAECDRQERIELLIDLARELPPLPERLIPLKESHRVPECVSPVFVFVEGDEAQVRLYADAPVESPTVRGFVSLLVGGLDGVSAAELLGAPLDLVRRAGLVEILGMQRIGGLEGVWRRLRQQVERLGEPSNQASISEGAQLNEP